MSDKPDIDAGAIGPWQAILFVLGALVLLGSTFAGPLMMFGYLSGVVVIMLALMAAGKRDKSK